MSEKEKPSMEKILREIAEMMEKIENYKGSLTPLESPGLVAANLDVLKSMMATFDEMVIEPLEKKHDMEALTKETLESPTVNSNYKQLVKQSLEVGQEAKILNDAFKMAIAKNKSRRKGKKGEESGNQQMKERRKLFKTIGGDKKWIPM